MSFFQKGQENATYLGEKKKEDQEERKRKKKGEIEERRKRIIMGPALLRGRYERGNESVHWWEDHPEDGAEVSKPW